MASIKVKLRPSTIADCEGTIYYHEFNRYAHEYSLFNFMESLIARLKQNGKTRTSETYRSTLNSFKKYRKDEDIMLDCITSETMEGYEAWHRKRGVAPNTISFYTRILRAVYNRALRTAPLHIAAARQVSN